MYPLQLKDLPLQHVITKLKLLLNNNRNFRSDVKNWRMGNTLSKMKGYKCTETIESWKDEEWKLKVDVSEVKYDEIKRKFEAKLEEKGKRKG